MDFLKIRVSKQDAIDLYIMDKYNDEVKNFIENFDNKLDFTKQLLNHDLFYMICMQNFSDQEYQREIEKIKSQLEQSDEYMECVICGNFEIMDNFVYRPDLVLENPKEYQNDEGDFLDCTGCLYSNCDICTNCEKQIEKKM